MLKRIIALLAVIALFGVLAACIKKPAEDKAGDQPANEGEGEYSILPVEDDNYTRPVVVPEDTGNETNLDPDAPVSHDAGDVAPPEYPHDANALYGSWRLMKVLAYGSVGTYSQEQAEALVGTILNFAEDKAQVLTDTPDNAVVTIESPVYDETEIDGETFYAEYRTGFPAVEVYYEAVPAIKISGENASSVVLFTAQDKIVLIAGGTFFAFSRVVK